MPTNSSAPTPLEQLTDDIRELQSDLNSLQTGVRLANIRDEIEDLETATNGLEQRIRNLRNGGYVFEKQLEAQARDMARRWGTIRLQAMQQVNLQSSQLEREMHSLEALLMQVSARANNVVQARPLVSQAQSALDSLKNSISAAESAIRGMYDSFQDELKPYAAHLKDLEWTLAQVNEASFQLLPSECAIQAVEAVWARDGKEDKNDPKGILYLTDQRVIFEQKQEIATKKVLFIATEKQKVQQLLLEFPVALIQSSKGTKQGLFKNEDHLEFSLAPGGPVVNAHFHLDGQDCNAWQGLVGQARTKAFDKDRVVPIDTEAAEKVKSAPTQCPSCGGLIKQVVLRGMDTITCEYCGAVIRL